MRKVIALGFMALTLLGLNSCKKCYECTREKFCYTCTNLSNSSDVQEKCAEANQSKDDFDQYISSIASSYNCSAKIVSEKDKNEICDGSLLQTYTGISLDKTQLEQVGWSCVNKK